MGYGRGNERARRRNDSSGKNQDRNEKRNEAETSDRGAPQPAYVSKEFFVVNALPKCSREGAPTKAREFEFSGAIELVRFREKVAPMPNLLRPCPSPLVSPCDRDKPTGQPYDALAAPEGPLHWARKRHDPHYCWMTKSDRRTADSASIENNFRIVLQSGGQLPIAFALARNVRRSSAHRLPSAKNSAEHGVAVSADRG
jgi:hypothetical protein